MNGFPYDPLPATLYIDGQRFWSTT